MSAYAYNEDQLSNRLIALFQEFQQGGRCARPSAGYPRL